MKVFIRAKCCPGFLMENYIKKNMGEKYKEQHDNEYF